MSAIGFLFCGSDGSPQMAVPIRAPRTVFKFHSFRTMKRLRLLLGLLAFTPLGSAVFAQTPSPTVIPFQGRLTNQQNVPYAEGKYTLTFNLYNEAVGGTTVWTERHEQVGVINGTVNVFLGSIQSITSVDFSTIKHLGITIDADANPLTADPEMVPRQMIIPAFWAKNSDKLAGHDWSAILVSGATSNDPTNGKIRGDKIADSGVTTAKIGALAITTAKLSDTSVTTAKLADGSITTAKLAADVATPFGTVVAYIGDSAPVGWLLCNGAEVSAATYPNLAALVGTRFGTASVAGRFKLPDFRGYFLRGVDNIPTGTPRDLDRANRVPMAPGGASGVAVGSVQLDQTRRHDHMTHAQGSTGGGYISNENSAYSGSGGHNFGFSPSPNPGFRTSIEGGNETRPLNAYVNYIIKY